MAEIRFPSPAKVFIPELRAMQDFKETRFKAVATDFESLPGIVEFPSTAGVGTSANFVIITNSGDPTKIDVGDKSVLANEIGGLGYTKDGSRILISDSLTWQSTTVTPGSGYSPIDPYGAPYKRSTGNLLVPLTMSATNYIWIDYLLVVNTGGIVVADASAVPLLWYTEFTDGYEIIVDQVSTPGFPPAGHANAIYLGTVTTTLTTVDTIVQTAMPRARRRGITLGVNTGTSATLPATYSDNADITAQDHVRSRGTGIVSNRNPHALTPSDIGISPNAQVSTHVQYYHSNGLTNITDPVGNTTSALYPRLSGDTKNVLIKGLAAQEFLTVQTTVYDFSSALTTVGRILTVPTVFSLSPLGEYDSGDFTGLGAATYYFYIDAAVSTAPRLLFVSGAAPVAATDFIICKAVWNATIFTSLTDYRVFNNNNALNLWRTATRPAIIGRLGFNLDLLGVEWYDGTAWRTSKEYVSSGGGTGTSYNFTHGLGDTPDHVTVQMTSSPIAGAWAYVSAVSSTTFTVDTLNSGVTFTVYAKRSSV